MRPNNYFSSDHCPVITVWLHYRLEHRERCDYMMVTSCKSSNITPMTKLDGEILVYSFEKCLNRQPPEIVTPLLFHATNPSNIIFYWVYASCFFQVYQEASRGLWKQLLPQHGAMWVSIFRRISGKGKEVSETVKDSMVNSDKLKTNLNQEWNRPIY